MKQNQFYCVKCRRKVTANPDDMYVKIYKNKRMYDGQAPALKSHCKSCATNLTKFIKHDSTHAMVEKYGK